MKKLFTILSIVALGFTACEGDPGPQGPPGLDGLDAEYSKVVEVETTLSYNSDSGIWESPIIEFPSNVEVLDGDAVIAYRLEYIDNGLDVWTQLPHNFFFTEGTMQYVFTHTIGDVQFLIDGNYDLSNISTDYTDNQIFRYVLIPTEFAEQFNGDFSNYNEVISALELNETDVQTLQ